MADIEDFLARRKQEGLLRSLKPASFRKGNKINFSGKEYIDFCSNDYLGLSFDPRIIEEIKKAADRFGTAVCASRLLSGDLDLHHQLERKVAGFKGKETALVFNSGYQANLGIISSLYGKGDCVFSDRLNHASIMDGIALSQAKLFRFRHNDTRHLKDLLEKQRAKFKKALIVTESVFSMDGDTAPLKELSELKEKYGCWLMVDEAHATGIFGDTGAGLVQQEGLEEKIDLIMGTFSKALAGFGAYLAASQLVVDYLVNTCRSFIYSTALPPAVIAGNLKSIELVEKEPERGKSLLSLAEYFRGCLSEKGLEVKGCSQIVPVIIGDNQASERIAFGLQQKGYWVLPVRPPTVPVGQARLRLSLNVYHDKKALEKFADDISKLKV